MTTLEIILLVALVAASIFSTIYVGSQLHERRHLRGEITDATREILSLQEEKYKLTADYEERIRGLGALQDENLATFRKAKADGALRELVIEGVRLVRPKTKITYSFDGTLNGAIWQFEDPTIRSFSDRLRGTTATRTPDQQVAYLSDKNSRLNELLATEKQRRANLDAWLTLIISRTGQTYVATDKQLSKTQRRFELRETRRDGELFLRVRPIGLGEDVADHKL